MIQPRFEPPRALCESEQQRVRRSCSHVLVPDQPAASGYRYVDLGGELPPMYVRRFSLGERSAAVTLQGPIELTDGHEAERGAPALARASLSIGPRLVAWDEMLDLDLQPGESMLLARAALDALLDLQLIDGGACPICAAD
jgi:hypothetical protein